MPIDLTEWFGLSGRVARAGRLGSAYSIVCPEELSYVIDLHLFLGRSMKFAQIGTVTQGQNTCF